MADEAEGVGSEDPLFLSEDLVQSPVHAAAATKSFDFEGLLQPALAIHTDLSKGNGGATWPAGETLARYLLRKKRDALENSSVVELGAGSGLVGLAIAVGCRPANPVHITDQEPMLALMERNVALNNLKGKVVASIYDWGTDRPPSLPHYPDVVLAADCVYFEPAFPLLQQTLRDLIGPETTCYFCFKKRRRADLHFIRKVKKDFLVEDVADDPDRDAYARENIFLCTIRRKPPR